MGVFIGILICIGIVVKFGETGFIFLLGLFLILCIIAIVFSDSKEVKQKLQEEKVKKVYGPNTPYLKRSELSARDIDLLRYQVENCDEILFTVNSVQELKLVLARIHSCLPSQVEIFGTGEIKVNQMYVNRWRYTPAGQIEYYIPALNSLKPELDEDFEDFEDFENLEDFNDFEFENSSEYIFDFDEIEEDRQAPQQDNVIKGPW